MTCQHCRQNRPHQDGGEYFTCSNCGHHQFKDPVLTMPNIPPPERKYNMNQNKLGIVTAKIVNQNMAKISSMRIKKMSWFALTKALIEATGHSMNPKTVQKHYERACNA